MTTDWLHTLCLGNAGNLQLNIRGLFRAKQRTAAVREDREGTYACVL